MGNILNCTKNLDKALKYRQPVDYAKCDEKSKEKLESRMCDACDYGMVEEVEYLLDIGVPPRAKINEDPSYRHPLCNLLPEKCGCISAKLRRNRLKILDLLCFHKADVNLQVNGIPLIHRFCQYGKNEDFTLLQKLVEHGADEKRKDRDGNLPFHWCFMREVANNKRILQYFLDAGVDLNCRNDRGDTPLHISAKYLNEGFIRYLTSTEGIELDAQNEDGNTPLHLAIQEYKGHWCSNIVGLKTASEACIEVLLQMKANVSIVNKQGLTPFAVALTKNGYIPNTMNFICKAFLRADADINTQDINGLTMLHHCLKACPVTPENSQIYRALIELREMISHGGNVNILDNTGSLALEYVFNNLEECNEYSEDVHNVLVMIILLHLSAGLNICNLSRDCCFKINLLFSQHRPKNEKTDKAHRGLISIGWQNVLIGHNLIEDDVTISSLQTQCIIVIRTHFQPNVVLAIKKLCVPYQLKQSILVIGFE